VFVQVHPHSIHSHTRTHTALHSYTLMFISFTHTCSVSHSHSLMRTHLHTDTIHTLSHSIPLTSILTHSHSCTPHTLPHIHSHTHTHTHTHSLLLHTPRATHELHGVSQCLIHRPIPKIVKPRPGREISRIRSIENLLQLFRYLAPLGVKLTGITPAGM
jgi:hypothetical protein